jgi:hypothetical protein
MEKYHIKKIKICFQVLLNICILFNVSYSASSTQEEIYKTSDSIIFRGEKILYETFEIPHQKDGLVEYQWYLDEIRAKEAWQYFADFNLAPIVRIAILEDERISLHKDYSENLSINTYEATVEADQKTNVKTKGHELYATYNEVKKIMEETENNKLAILNKELNKKEEKIVQIGRIKELVSSTSEKIPNLHAASNYSPLGIADHPTNVTGIIASAHGDYGIKGICPFAEIIPFYIKIEDDNLKMEDYSYIAPVYKFLELASPDIVNASLNFLSRTDNEILMKEIRGWSEYFRKNNQGEFRKNKLKEKLKIPIIVSAGNKDEMDDEDSTIDERIISSSPFIPVGATTRKGTVAKYSNSGDKLRIYAPGGDFESDLTNLANNILTTSFYEPNLLMRGEKNWTGGWTYDFGQTSSSASIASGVVGLMLAINPNLERDEIENILFKSGDNCKDSVSNKKLINAENAVKKSFWSIIDKWGDFWSKKEIDGYKFYYDNNSIVVRGVKLSSDLINYRVFADPQVEIDVIKHEIDRLKNMNSNFIYQYTIDDEIQPIDSLLKRVNSLNQKYKQIEINLTVNPNQITPQKASIGESKNNLIVDRLEIIFYQTFRGYITENFRYEDKGWKFLMMERKRGENQLNEWLIKKEIWIYDPTGEKNETI